MVRLDSCKAGGRADRPSRRLIYAAVSGLALCLPETVAAQAAPPQVLPPTREEVTRPSTPPVVERAPHLDVEGGLERAPCALDGPEFKTIRLTLRGVDFEGLQQVSAADLSPAYANLVGTEQPVSVVCDIRDRAAAILRDAGYIAAVEVPEQKIADGIVHYRVLMAHLGQVRVRGDATGAERVIAAYLNELTRQPVFNRFDAERYLLLASDLPGYTVRLTLRPAGTTPGEVLGDVTVQRVPVYVDANIQNGGSSEVGPWGGLLRAQIFGLTGLGDRTTFGVFTSADLKEQQTVQIGHDFHVGGEGLDIGGMFTYAWADPTIRPAGTNIRAHTLLGTVQADYPLIRSLARTLRSSVGVDYINQDVDLNSVPLTRDRLRVGFLRFAFDALDTVVSPGRSPDEPKWHVTSSIELRKGLDIFGATSPCGPGGALCLGPSDIPPSRTEGLATATLVRGLLYGEYRPIPKLTFALGARAQYAWNPLLSFEEFSVGNYTVGRGYDPGTLIGDRGWGTQAEIRVGSIIPAAPGKAAGEAYVFWDHARISDLDRLFLASGSKQLDSVGAGARVNWDRFSLDANLALPLTRVGAIGRKPGPRILVSLTSRLWPWSYK